MPALWLPIVCSLLGGAGPDPARSSSDPPVVLRFASLAPRGSSWDWTFKKVFDEVGALTGGTVKSRLYMSGVLGDEPEIVEKMMRGEVDGALVTTLGIQAIVPEMAVLEVPFLFDSAREIDRIRPWLHRRFGAQFEKKGLMLLSLAEVGFIQVYSREKVSVLGDLLGRKVWVWEGNIVHREAYRALGIEPIPLPVPSVLEALATGRIEVVTTGPLSCLALGWYQHLRYVYKLDYRYAPAVVLIRREALDRLTPTQVKLLETTFQKYEPDIILTTRQDNETALAGMKKRGMEIIVPDPAARDEFKRKTGQVVDRLVSQSLFPRALYDEILRMKGD